MKEIEIRVCLENKCNFNCTYCQPGGEGSSRDTELLSEKDLLIILRKLVKYGVSSVRLTGGEPLLRSNFDNIANDISSIPNIEQVSLVTNGSLLNYENVNKIEASSISNVTVSLDTLNREKFYKIVGKDSLDIVLNGIELLVLRKIPVRINSVISKSNIDDLKDLINYCRRNEIKLKVLDLVQNEFNEWNKEFLNLNIVMKELEKISSEKNIINHIGNFGTPMTVFKIDPIEVFIKDNTIGTCYSKKCLECQKYPCQSGIVSLILTHDGFLKLCTLSNEFNLDLKPLLHNNNDTEKKVNNFFDNYKSSTFQNKWYEKYKDSINNLKGDYYE
ncbi:hypothetical protein CIW83_05540 [Tissierella sp. P1]|uniref:radical SAM protein n=1 Tax=Tissierella sp. P1 TaxID=1280483 RepID=UPI000B9F99E9|nr:radical SAM protein [Tissierella sp. P1]OZV13009.1 hypothetical protein CIW83_05540 [Tissierella sp. P1]